MICKAILDNCPNEATHLDYCAKHYMRFKRWGSPYYRKQSANNEYQGCKAPGCHYPHKGKGFCDAHLKRLQRNGHIADSLGLILIRGV